MKRLLRDVIVGVFIAISLACFSPIMDMHVSAESLVYGDFSYIVDDKNEVIIMGYKGTNTSVTIPQTIGGKTVTEIGKCAFEENMDIVNVKLPDTITKIDYKAFSRCKNLETINFPDSLKTIGEYAFTTCHSLKEIELGNQIEKIGTCAFQLCISLSEITVPGTVKTVVNHAFHGCHNVNELLFEEGVTTIESGAAVNMYSIDRIVIPRSVTTIGDYAVGYAYYYPNYTRIDATIYGYRGTAAEAYAKNNSFTFVALDKEQTNPNVVLGDITPSSWAYKYVKYVCEKGYMKGKKVDAAGKTIFDPTETLTRAEFVQVLYNVEGQPPVTYKDKFSDVPGNQWYSYAVSWATKKGIVDGYGNGKFGVNDRITREQLATMLYKYAQYKGYKVNATANLNTYADANKVSSWAVNYMKWLVGSGIMSGKNGRLEPQEYATRAECAALVNKFLVYYGK